VNQTAKCRDCLQIRVKVKTTLKGKFHDEQGQFWYGHRCPECSTMYRKKYDGGWRHGQEEWPEDQNRRKYA
jgi:hypothetical protein